MAWTTLQAAARLEEQATILQKIQAGPITVNINAAEGRIAMSDSQEFVSKTIKH